MLAPVSIDNSLLQTSPTHKHRQPIEWLVLLECVAPRGNVDRLAYLLQNPFSWPVLLQRAEDHGVVPLVAERIRTLDPAPIPLEVRARFRESRRAYGACSLQMTAELFRVLERFAEAGIETLATKGPALSARCYGDPSMRQYSDLDLVVREADIRRATQHMLDLAYHPRIPLRAIDAKKMPGEYAFRKLGTDLLVEFHTERTFRYHPRRLPMETVFARSSSVTIDAREIPALSIEDELILICIHGAKHFWERLMWIADVAALVSNNAVDWNRATAAASEVGAERMLRLGLRLATDVASAALPEQVAAEVRADSGAAHLAARVAKRLAADDTVRMGILERAAFRVRMRGRFWDGVVYLMRLSLSPTEEDWIAGAKTDRPWLLDALRRPMRLARKHGPNSKT